MEKACALVAVRLKVRTAEPFILPNLSNEAPLSFVDADFFLAGVAPDFARVGDPLGPCLLGPVAHLVFVLIEPIATKDVAPCERFGRITHQTLAYGGIVVVAWMPPGGGDDAGWAVGTGGR